MLPMMETPAYSLHVSARMHVSNPRFRPVRWPLLRNWGLVLTCVWSSFALYSYLVTLLSVASYATQGLGLRSVLYLIRPSSAHVPRPYSHARGASVQAVFAAGQLVGRPSLGLILDRFGRLLTAWPHKPPLTRFPGRIYMASLVSLLSGVACLCIWIVAKTYGVLLFFGLASVRALLSSFDNFSHDAHNTFSDLKQGIFSGIFFSALGPVLSEVVSLADFSDALSIIWIVCAPITLVCTPIAFALDEYSESVLGRSGAEAFQIAIGTAGGANVVAALALFAVKRYQRKE